MRLALDVTPRLPVGVVTEGVHVAWVLHPLDHLQTTNIDFKNKTVGVARIKAFGMHSIATAPFF